MSSLVERAKWFATQAHKVQIRKYTGGPYIEHCAEVVSILMEIGASDSQLAAAWLHDTVEDCGVRLETIEALFGDEIAGMVNDLTDVSKPSDGNRATRKALDLKHTAAARPESKTIKLADLISNTKSIVERDPSFAKIYLAEKRELLKVLTEGNAELWARAYQQSFLTGEP